MGSHLIDGQFKSDKYAWSPPGFVPLKVTDPMAQDLLWEYAQRRRTVDAEFADDLETALRGAGYKPYIEPPLTAALLGWLNMVSQAKYRQLQRHMPSLMHEMHKLASELGLVAPYRGSQTLFCITEKGRAALAARFRR